MPQSSQHISHFLIGIPASGKSTFAHWLQAQTQGIIICPDNIRATLYGDASIQGDWSDITGVIEQQIQQAIATQTTIIYDATNAQQTWRREFLQQYRQLQWLGWHIKTPLKTCLQRNQNRQRTVPPEIVRGMHQNLRLDPPILEDGLDNLIEVKGMEVNEGDAIFMALKKQHPQYLGD